MKKKQMKRKEEGGKRYGIDSYPDVAHVPMQVDRVAAVLLERADLI